MNDQSALERIDMDQPAGDAVQLDLHAARYRFAVPWVQEKRVLDMACGTGYGSAMLARSGAREVHGVDLDADAIAHARERFNGPGVNYAIGDAEAPPVQGSFDVVVSFETIEHLQLPERFLTAVSRLLAPDGVFLVSTPCRVNGTLSDRPENPFHVREWNQAEFTQLLSLYFANVEIRGQLLEFAKNRLPLNRTLARWITVLFAPSRLRNMYSCEVLPLDTLPIFPVWISYMVAVCRKPR